MSRVLLQGVQDQEEEKEEEEEETAEDTLLFLLPPPWQLPVWRWKQGITHEYAVYEFKDEGIHTVVSDTLRAEPLNSVHIKEVTGCLGLAENAPCMNEMNKVTEKQVLREEEVILNNELPALSLYRDRTHMHKTAKDFICLLFDLSPHYGLQLGRANAVLRRLHGADDDLTLKKVADEGLRMEVE